MKPTESSKGYSPTIVNPENLLKWGEKQLKEIDKKRSGKSSVNTFCDRDKNCTTSNESKHVLKVSVMKKKKTTVTKELHNDKCKETVKENIDSRKYKTNIDENSRVELGNEKDDVCKVKIKKNKEKKRSLTRTESEEGYINPVYEGSKGKEDLQENYSFEGQVSPCRKEKKKKKGAFKEKKSKYTINSSKNNEYEVFSKRKDLENKCAVHSEVSDNPPSKKKRKTKGMFDSGTRDAEEEQCLTYKRTNKNKNRVNSEIYAVEIPVDIEKPKKRKKVDSNSGIEEYMTERKKKKKQKRSENSDSLEDMNSKCSNKSEIKRGSYCTKCIEKDNTEEHEEFMTRKKKKKRENRNKENGISKHSDKSEFEREISSAENIEKEKFCEEEDISITKRKKKKRNKDIPNSSENIYSEHERKIHYIENAEKEKIHEETDISKTKKKKRDKGKKENLDSTENVNSKHKSKYQETINYTESTEEENVNGLNNAETIVSLSSKKKVRKSTRSFVQTSELPNKDKETKFNFGKSPLARLLGVQMPCDMCCKSNICESKDRCSNLITSKNVMAKTDIIIKQEVGSEIENNQTDVFEYADGGNKINIQQLNNNKLDLCTNVTIKQERFDYIHEEVNTGEKSSHTENINLPCDINIKQEIIDDYCGSTELNLFTKTEDSVKENNGLLANAFTKTTDTIANTEVSERNTVCAVDQADSRNTENCEAYFTSGENNQQDNVCKEDVKIKGTNAESNKGNNKAEYIKEENCGPLFIKTENNSNYDVKFIEQGNSQNENLEDPEEYKDEIEFTKDRFPVDSACYVNFCSDTDKHTSGIHDFVKYQPSDSVNRSQTEVFQNFNNCIRNCNSNIDCDISNIEMHIQDQTVGQKGILENSDLAYQSGEFSLHAQADNSSKTTLFDQVCPIKDLQEKYLFNTPRNKSLNVQEKYWLKEFFAIHFLNVEPVFEEKTALSRLLQVDPRRIDIYNFEKIDKPGQNIVVRFQSEILFQEFLTNYVDRIKCDSVNVCRPNLWQNCKKERNHKQNKNLQRTHLRYQKGGQKHKAYSGKSGK